MYHGRQALPHDDGLGCVGTGGGESGCVGAAAAVRWQDAVTATVVTHPEVTTPACPARTTVVYSVVGAGWKYCVTVCVPKLQCAVEVGGMYTTVWVSVRVVSMARLGSEG